MTHSVALGPIDARDALEATESKLLDLLRSLTLAEWQSPTMVNGWCVRHVAGHLLDTALRKLSIVRDGYAAERPASGAAEDVRAFVDRLNGEGVRVLGRLSPMVITELMAAASRAYCAYHRALDPDAPAVFAVSWAGETQSLNWFDTARELTERWHHQAQIRLAVDRPDLMQRPLYHPVLDCFMRALPHRYRDIPAPAGTHVLVRVDGDAGGDWHLYRAAERWMLTSDSPGAAAATIVIPSAIAWRVFTKGIARVEAERMVTLTGDRGLAVPVLDTVAIVG